MTNYNESTVHTTGLGTLWSETLLEMLFDGLRNDWSGNALLEILKELNNKGYRMDRVVKKVRNRLGDDTARLLLLKIKK